MEKKIKKIQERLKEENLDAFLVSNSSNIFYLTGLGGISPEREFLLIVSRQDWEIIAPEMYFLEAKRKINNFFSTKNREGLFSKAVEELKNYKNIGFEKNDLKYGEHESLSRNLSSGKFFPTSGFCEDLRKIKSQEEINLIKKAATIADKTFYSILKIIKPGLTEKFIQRKIIEIMQDWGADDSAFLPIVASGKGSAEPHHLALNKKIKKGEILLLDFGAKYKGYCSDMTRTFFIGKAPQKFKKIYELVLKTQQEAIRRCKPGCLIKKLYQDVVLNFKKYKTEKNFLHNLGHGLGIDVHEFPALDSATEGVFEPGMTITIEPGLYYKNFGGVRIEDLCLVNDKCETLSKATKRTYEI